MPRVAKPARYVGIHDLCWKEDTPEQLKQRLAEIEGEEPETLQGWKSLFERVGLEEVTVVDESFLMRSWGRDIRKRMGIVAPLRIFITVAGKWGLSGIRRIAESARLFQSVHTGYGIIVGRKPGVRPL